MHKGGARRKNKTPPQGLQALQGKTVIYVDDLVHATGLTKATLLQYIKEAGIRIPMPEPRPYGAAACWDPKRRDVRDWILGKVERYYYYER